MKLFAIGLWAIAVIATGYTLFYITFQVEALETELTQLNRDILEEQDSVHVLKAEWSYLNRPDRLEKLTTRLLPGLGELSPDQIGALAELPNSPIVDKEDAAHNGISVTPNVGAIPVSMGASQ